ncbi:hypothetical protein EDB83DRAFT_2537420 [Lactarius deliciosus]|nr:hypothetical protein EDB83DRAFT_2537420 [Lactarius deliciosus]
MSRTPTPNFADLSDDSDYADPHDTTPDSGPTDITEIPDDLAAEPDDRVKQSEVLNMIIATNRHHDANIDNFNRMEVKRIDLSNLERLYESENTNAIKLLSRCHTINIDKEFCLEVGCGKIGTRTKKTMIDFHLTVANCIGLSPILPNALNSHHFSFELDLKKPFRDFKAKHAMVGFDTKGRFLFIGKAMNEDVFLAMAPNDFLYGNRDADLSPPGHSTGSPLLSRRHYRQLVMMFAHFLEQIPDKAYTNIGEVYEQNLDNEEPEWYKTTNIFGSHGHADNGLL